MIREGLSLHTISLATDCDACDCKLHQEAEIILPSLVPFSLLIIALSLSLSLAARNDASVRKDEDDRASV